MQKRRERMVLEGETKIYRSNGRQSIYVPAGLVNDSTFPFTLKDRLKIKIEGDKLIITKLPASSPIKKVPRKGV